MRRSRLRIEDKITIILSPNPPPGCSIVDTQHAWSTCKERIMTIRRIDDSAGLVSLSKRDVLSLAGRPGTRIESRHGGLWVTQDGDSRDIVLERGEAFVLDRCGPVLVQALDPALVVVERPANQGARAPGLWQRLTQAALSA